MPTPPIISLENITFAYPERPTLFKNLCFDLREGEWIGLHGPNGSGKTTLLRLIMGLEIPESGRVSYRGEQVDNNAALHRLRCRVGFVMQNSDDQLFSATVLEDVAFGPLNLGMGRRAARDRALETLETLELTKLAERATHRLSVGEKKMVSIATVLSMRPEALILDEPTASLDDHARARISEILRRQPLARIIVSHDHDFLRETTSSLVRVNSAGAVEWETAPPSQSQGESTKY